MNQPASVMAEDDEAEQQFESCGGNHEEIDRGDAIGVVSQKKSSKIVRAAAGP